MKRRDGEKEQRKKGWNRILVYNRVLANSEKRMVILFNSKKLQKGLIQDLETVCQKLTINFLGVLDFKGVHNILRLQP